MSLRSTHSHFSSRQPYSSREQAGETFPGLLLICTRRSRSICNIGRGTWDRDSNGLCEWASACQSGEDNQFDRAGVWRSYFCEGVDLNSFLYLDLLAAEKIASAMGYGEDAVSFAKEASTKKA